ncbi:ATP-dependent RecD-like DNA helicase [Anaeromassilibacillus senegalensis]|uniref:ATP-dependent RecD2 DNA helicase n=2 Tax=Anaeromassilibacillus senegalensis TaxID=1673717 RepID=A0ABS9CLM4_9FIRM|nr:ATP-dependent RecD-like DNA helicase [Anaeromassilibacillus senegalensis]
MEGSVENIVYHNDSNQYTVLEINCGEELVTVVGTFPYISVGEKLHLYGTWTSHATFGQQFKAEAFERSRPESTSAMLKYLSSGAVKGIGAATAGKIIAAFGDEAIHIIENDPERLATIKGITLKRAREISEEMQRVNGIRDLMAFLGGFGVRPEDAVKVWKEYGTDSVACIQEDPYRLCSEKIAVEFTVADKLAESLEYDRANTERVKAGILYVLRHNLNNGHTCLPADKLCAAAARMLGVPLEDAQSALLSLCQSFDAVCENFDGRDFIFLPRQHRSEVYSADRIRMLLKYPPESIVGIDREIEEIERAENIQYAEMQKEAIRAALDKGLLILTGGPGTGKTTTLNAIIRILMEKGEAVALAAPTGRAAKRMSELTGVEAKTIHRLLQVDWDENDNPVFQRNERNPLECDALVIDELSMVDSYVFESVLRALPIGCRLILVGDSDQLPSVGAGNVIGDLIASGVFPTVQLKEIFRQSMESLIVTNAHRIVSGEMPVLNVRDNDFFFMPVDDAHTVSETILSLAVTRLPKRYGYSPVTDIQVLCPGRKGELGTIELNRRLREQINPQAKDKPQMTVNGTVFRVGDKVMQIKNDYDLPWSRPDGTTGEGVYNGDMGIVTDVDKAAGCMRVMVDDREVLYDFDHAAAELELAYAVTVHKSQGNEFTAVIMPVFPGIPQLSYRNLLYTGITRAKQLLILVGRRSAIADMVANDRKTRRFSGLMRFLTEETAE